MTKISQFFCILTVFFASTAAIASDHAWTISDADGQVTVTRQGKPLYGAQGTVLKAGDVISTSKNARAVLVRGGKFVVVDPGKKVRIEKPKQKGTATRIFEYLGSLVSSDPKTNSFNAGTAAAVVKGLGDGIDETGYSQSASGNVSARDDDPAMWKQVEEQSL